ncbi:MAG: response regulator [Syntrophaceae bacterium]|nr:response regulator [Syntrophaceae bacterium]
MEDRILIVDDEEAICRLFAERLAQEGYICVTARNGREALRWFLKDPFSLMIADIRMPEMDGVELLKRVKATDPKMMVIVITAHPDIDLAVEAMRLGAYDFIIKPVDLDLLSLSVTRALEKKRLEEEISAYRLHLERLVEERTAKLQEAYRILKKAHLDSVKVLAEAIDAKDPYTRGHSDRVTRMSLKIAFQLGFTEDRLESLEYGALLHDIGKIGIRDEVLQKPTTLDSDEYQYIQEHPLIGVRILEGLDFFKDKIPVIRHHHEHFDGSGYPDGLAGEAIPLEARIVAVPDAFDAMTSSRPHRGMMPLQDVLTELERWKGIQFDPNVVEIFLHEKIYKL